MGSGYLTTGRKVPFAYTRCSTAGTLIYSYPVMLLTLPCTNQSNGPEAELRGWRRVRDVTVDVTARLASCSVLMIASVK